MFPVQDHLSLICSKYLDRTLQSNNPSYNVVTSPFGIRVRRMIETLQSRFLHRLAPYLSNVLLSSSNYGKTMKFLHTETVSETMQIFPIS